jgi:hypothetical protein
VGGTGQKGNGQVVNVTYENVTWTATAGANGIYTIKLPASDISSNNSYYYLSSTNVFGFVLDFGEFTHDFTHYTDGSIPYIVRSPALATPTYTSTYIYRVNNVGGWQWTSVQSTSLTATWSFFYSETLK